MDWIGLIWVGLDWVEYWTNLDGLDWIGLPVYKRQDEELKVVYCLMIEAKDINCSGWEVSIQVAQLPQRDRASP